MCISIFDDRHKKVLICGSYAEKPDKDIVGIYYIKERIENLSGIVFPKFIPYEEKLSSELIHGKRKNRRRVLDDLYVEDVLFRNDGGVIFYLRDIKRVFQKKSL